MIATLSCPDRLRFKPAREFVAQRNVKYPKRTGDARLYSWRNMGQYLIDVRVFRE
jgi:hypothetical protein